MACNPFHLAWFLQGSSIQAWGADWTGNISEEWMGAGMFLDLARNIERAGFDYLLLEDSIYVGQNWQDKRDIFLENRDEVLPLIEGLQRQIEALRSAIAAGDGARIGEVLEAAKAGRDRLVPG